MLSQNRKNNIEINKESNISYGEKDDPKDIFNMPIKDLKLSARACNCLKSENIETVGELIQINSKEVIKIPNLGHRTYYELRERIKEHGIEWI